MKGLSPNSQGSLWMMAAMAGFAVEDAFLKAAGQTLPVAQILMLFGGGGALVFAALARRYDQPLAPPEVLSGAMLIRVVFEIMGRLFYLLAIVLTPLSSATVILQATPLVVVAGAALIFGETVGPRRWLAIGIGLLGVVVILQPGAESFTPLSMLAVLGMIGFAGRDLASRAAPASLSTYVLGLYGFLPIILAGALYMVWEDRPFMTPDPWSGLMVASAVVAGVTAYGCLMTAMRTGEVSAVTPFRYTRLIFGILLGVAVFGEALSATTLLGCGLIVIAGLFILWRKRTG